MPSNTGAGLIIAGFSFVLGFGLIWYIWWMAILGFIGMIATAILHSFKDDHGYYIKAADVARMEEAHKAQREQCTGVSQEDAASPKAYTAV